MMTASPAGIPLPSSRCVYPFSRGESDGGRQMKELLGGKGALLCEMSKIGMNVPPGLVISTKVCEAFHHVGGHVPEQVWAEVDAAMVLMETRIGRRFGDASNPLLVSARSGAALSMPGMMETVLNLGMNDDVVEGLARKHGDRFAYDCYRRLLEMFGDVVLHIPRQLFSDALDQVKRACGVQLDIELNGDALRNLVSRFKAIYDDANKTFPTDPRQQLRMAIEAVFKSWNTPRAIKYREIHKITGLAGTAVTVQAMVYGNRDEASGSGVLFTRDPATGARELFGEFLSNAQGEDVVSGVRTPLPISQMKQIMPSIYTELDDTTRRLEQHMKQMQDVEFTIESGELFILQCRDGKRTGHAALRIAIDMVDEGIVTKDEAVCMVEGQHLQQLLHPQLLGEAYKKHVIATGLAASPGAAVGQIVFDAVTAETQAKAGMQVLLVRIETSADDVAGCFAAVGILTARGGKTSHAAVVARGAGKPAVVGCEALHVNQEAKLVQINGLTLHEGDWLTINGTTGEVVKGKQTLERPTLTSHLGTLMSWADERRKLGVKANADTPDDARLARANGAAGIGLCRSEHMFFKQDRIHAMRRMIICEQLEQTERKAEALEALRAYQTEDFASMFAIMTDLPVTIRLLDPPLHEFLPTAGHELELLLDDFATEFDVPRDQLRSLIAALHEANPMLGLRGCRLGIVHPDVTEMQARAIFEAAVRVVQSGIKMGEVEIMIPLVSMVEELDDQLALIHRCAAQVFEAQGCRIAYKVGTMIETPRACILADKLAPKVGFFSVGSNDLSALTFGLSRDDVGKFLPCYKERGILERDPFENLDCDGVGPLIRIMVERARAANRGIEIGLCGEHGGDPKSIEFLNSVGMDYVSCSPLRVPIARLAAAQAAIRGKTAKTE